MQPIQPLLNRPVASIAPVIPVAGAVVRPRPIVPIVQAGTPQPIVPVVQPVGQPVTRPLTADAPIARPSVVSIPAPRPAIAPVTRPIVPQPAATPVARPVVPQPVARPFASPNVPLQQAVARPVVPQPVASPWLQQVASPFVSSQQVGGVGIMSRLARSRTNTTQAAVMAQAGPTFVPQFTIVQETEETLLRSLNHVWPATDAEITTLTGVIYADGTPIINLRRRDIIMEIIGMIINNDFESILDFIRDAPSPEFILWDQSAMNESRIKLAREITIHQAEQVGIKGVGKCRYCTSKELSFSMKQMRSGDEPMTVFVRCVLCNKQWKE